MRWGCAVARSIYVNQTIYLYLARNFEAISGEKSNLPFAMRYAAMKRYVVDRISSRYDWSSEHHVIHIIFIAFAKYFWYEVINVGW